MESKRTPNQPKTGGLHPKSAGSSSKFARPRNRQQDANSTIVFGRSNHNLTTMTATRNMNQTLNPNLDVTMSGYPNLRIKQNICAPTSDLNVKYELAYNDYLQALMKQQIVRKTIDEHKEKLNDQILVHSEHLHKLENTYKDISIKIENLKQQGEIVDIINMLKDSMDEIERLCDKYNTHNRVQQITDILTEELNLVSVRNIKPIGSQEEYDEFISILTSLIAIIEKIQNAGRNFEEVNQFATAIKNFDELQNTVAQTAIKLRALKKKVTATLIQHGSDMFAKLGGYY